MLSFLVLEKTYDEISANGKDVWCAATIKAAKERNSERLAEADSDIKAAPGGSRGWGRLFALATDPI